MTGPFDKEVLPDIDSKTDLELGLRRKIDESASSSSIFTKLRNFSCKDVTDFIRDDLLSFYPNGLPWKKRLPVITARTVQTLISAYMAWGAFEQSNEWLKSYSKAEGTSWVVILFFNSIFAAGTFLFTQKVGGKGAEFLTQYRYIAKEQSDALEEHRKEIDLLSKENNSYKEAFKCIYTIFSTPPEDKKQQEGAMEQLRKITVKF